MPTDTTDTVNTAPSGAFIVINVIVDSAKPGQIRVVFAESARYYILVDNNPHFASSLRLLQQAKIDQQPIKVYFNKVMGNTIELVEPLDRG